MQTRATRSDPSDVERPERPEATWSDPSDPERRGALRGGLRRLDHESRGDPDCTFEQGKAAAFGPFDIAQSLETRNSPSCISNHLHKLGR